MCDSDFSNLVFTLARMVGLWAASHIYRVTRLAELRVSREVLVHCALRILFFHTVHLYRTLPVRIILVASLRLIV